MAESVGHGRGRVNEWSVTILANGECGMRNAECGMRGLLIDAVGLSRRRRGTESTFSECGMRNAECGMRNFARGSANFGRAGASRPAGRMCSDVSKQVASGGRRPAMKPNWSTKKACIQRAKMTSFIHFYGARRLFGFPLIACRGERCGGWGRIAPINPVR